MLRVLLGIIKGGLVGAVVGFGATKAGIAGGAASWLVFGAIGFLTGIVCGKAIWRQETLVTPILKGVFGLGLGVGLYWVSTKVLGGVNLPLPAALGLPEGPLPAQPAILGPIIGILYGVFVEVDDGGERKAAAAAAADGAKK